jgi:hypothetical protein
MVYCTSKRKSPEIQTPREKRQRDGKRNALHGFFWRFAEINRKPVGVDFLIPAKNKMNMKKVIVNVAKTPAGYSASIDILPGWALGTSGSFDEFKKELGESIDIFIEWAKADGDEYPAVFDGEYGFEYKFNIESLLYSYKDILSRAAISRITGINERQLGHYICGRSRPREDQQAKIVNAFHQLGKELLSVSV